MIVNRSVPSATVIPVLSLKDVGKASDWPCDVFGFRERLRIGTHRAQLVFGDGAVILTEPRVGQGLDAPASAELRLPGSAEVSHSVPVQVDDVDRHYDRARERNARMLRPPTDYLIRGTAIYGRRS